MRLLPGGRLVLCDDVGRDTGRADSPPRPGPPSCLRQPRTRPARPAAGLGAGTGIHGSARSRADFRAGAGVPAREPGDPREERIAGLRRPLSRRKQQPQPRSIRPASEFAVPLLAEMS
jgi:hypothetical protein